MPAPISVIIPSLDAADTLPAALASLVEGLEAGLIRELIVADGGSKDGTGAIAQAWGGEVLSAAPSRGGQLRQGCAAARGAWLLILHADTRLSPGWAEVVTHHMRGEKAGWFRLRFDRGGALVARWANLRSRLGLPYGDQGLLLPKDLYEAVGGYPDQPLMEDVAIARALRGKLCAIDAVAVTSAEKYRQQGWVRRGARNLWTLARYAMGAPADELARAYRR